MQMARLRHWTAMDDAAIAGAVLAAGRYKTTAPCPRCGRRLLMHRWPGDALYQTDRYTCLACRATVATRSSVYRSEGRHNGYYAGHLPGARRALGIKDGGTTREFGSA